MEKGKETSENGGGITMGVKVMTDEQMEMLRKQISVYAILCDRLLDMHKSLSSQPHHFAPSGMRIGNPYCDPLLSSTVHKLTSRQRWTPKPEQLQILEGIFDQCSSSPGRQRIKEIAAELAHYGPISEANVYNWFQNRRARSKRKQSGTVTTDGEPEAEMETEINKDENMKQEDVQLDENSPLLVSHMYFQSPEIGKWMCLQWGD